MIKDTLKLILIFLISALTITGAWHLFHKENENKKSEIITRSDTTRIVLHDTLWYHLAGRIKKTDSIFIAVPAKVDTAAILKIFFARFAYVDTLKDSALVAVIADTISENKIIDRKFSYQILKPQLIETIVNTKVEQKQKAAFYMGAFAGGNKNSFGFGAEIFLITKTQTAYGLGYDLQNKTLSAHVGWKIHL